MVNAERGWPPWLPPWPPLLEPCEESSGLTFLSDSVTTHDSRKMVPRGDGSDESK